MEAALSPQQLLDFSGKVVVVTGAGSGLGSGIALRFADAGATVVVHYRSSRAGAEAAAQAIRDRGREALAVQADLTRSREVERLLDATLERFAALDVLINNASAYPLSALLDMTEAEWDAVLDSTLKSVHLCTQAAALRMKARGRGGAIVNIASIEAQNPAPRHAHYDAAKAGVLMHTRAAAQELGCHGIRVNAVSPGLIWREGLETAWPEGVTAYLRAAPLGRLGRPDDVADACLFLASPAARWITGANLLVDGGVMTNRIF